MEIFVTVSSFILNWITLGAYPLVLLALWVVSLFWKSSHTMQYLNCLNLVAAVVGLFTVINALDSAITIEYKIPSYLLLALILGFWSKRNRMSFFYSTIFAILVFLMVNVYDIVILITMLNRDFLISSWSSIASTPLGWLIPTGVDFVLPALALLLCIVIRRFF